jgi:hypothetical protein
LLLIQQRRHYVLDIDLLMVQAHGPALPRLQGFLGFFGEAVDVHFAAPIWVFAVELANRMPHVGIYAYESQVIRDTPFLTLAVKKTD